MDYCFIIIPITVLVTLVAIIIFIKISRIEKQINKLYKKKEGKIEKENKSTKTTEHIEGAIKNIKEEYKPRIEELERKRRFLLDKVPFLKK